MTGTLIAPPGFSDFGGTSKWSGAKFTADSGDTTTHDWKVPHDLSLYGGTFWADDNAKIGDHIHFQVVDVDDILGGGAGAVLSEYVEDVYVVPEERRTFHSGQAAEVVKDLYLRTTYHSVGNSDVAVLVDFLTFKAE